MLLHRPKNAKSFSSGGTGRKITGAGMAEIINAAAKKAADSPGREGVRQGEASQGCEYAAVKTFAPRANRKDPAFSALLNHGDRPKKRIFARNQQARDEREAVGTDSASIYLSHIRKFTLLTPVEEKELAARIAKGDKLARKRMIESNLRLVVNIAKRYLNRGLPLQDLIEEGNIGLIKSVERFKASKDCKFSTYATYWIKQAVERAIANQSSTVRLPIHIGSDMSKLSRAARELMTVLEREPSIAELSQKTGLTGRYVKKLSTIGRKCYSLDSAFTDEDDQTLLDRLEDEKFPSPTAALDTMQRASSVQWYMDMLEDNEKKVLKMRFGFDDDEPRTLEAIGKAFGVTRERVRQIEVKALEKIKKAMSMSEITVSYAV